MVRMMIRVPTSRCNERISAVDTGCEASQPGTQQAILLEDLIHGGQAQDGCQHQRGKNNRRRPGDSGVDFGGLHAKHGLRFHTLRHSPRESALPWRRATTLLGNDRIRVYATRRDRASTKRIKNNPSRRARRRQSRRTLTAREPAKTSPVRQILAGSAALRMRLSSLLIASVNAR